MTTETRYFGNQLFMYVVLAWLDLGGQGILTYLPEFCIHLYSSDFLDMEKKIVKIITVYKTIDSDWFICIISKTFFWGSGVWGS